MDAVQLISKRESLVLKGIGIILMLVHHLFYSEWSQGLYNDIYIHGNGIVNQIGLFCKLCVAVFVFVSGYGLAAKYGEGLNLKQYYLHRFKKLYLNYWFIWLLFVPVGVFVFHRTFEDVYQDHVVVKAGLDFLGLLHLTGLLGYNPTWWFYSCIIVLYLLFPWLNKRFDKSPFLIMTLCFFVAVLDFLPFIQPYGVYLITFGTGMLMARKPELFKEISTIECIIALCLLCMMRLISGRLTFIVDTLICIGLAMLLYRVRLPKWLETAMASLGKHSMNIFLFHTFIFYYWFSHWIYITRNPFIIFISLLIPCYLISVLIEFVKEKTGFNKLIG